MPRGEVMGHMLGGNNLGIHTCRQISIQDWAHGLATNLITDDCYVSNKTSERGYTFPLYLYPCSTKAPFFDDQLLFTSSGRRPNLAPVFIKDVSAKLKLTFIPNGKGDLDHSFGPEDVFHYTYAVLYSPNYRRRYAEFLKIDFPRIPLTTDVQRFRALSQLGRELVALHLMEKTASPITHYPMEGDDKVDQVRYTEPGIDGTEGLVWINKTQYFEGVPPEVWGFHIGGYQVAQKWLKDRKGRQLTYDDLTHYQRIISALVETLRIQNEIDRVIGKWPIS